MRVSVLVCSDGLLGTMSAGHGVTLPRDIFSVACVLSYLSIVPCAALSQLHRDVLGCVSACLYEN